MYRQLCVAVVIPAFNEVKAIAAAVAAVPEFVDLTIVVDDASTDDTAACARDAGAQHRGFALVCHDVNRGVGAAIVSGYRHALELGADVVAVMAGDGQMDPADLPGLLEPVALGHADYAKGNRFLHRSVWTEMPPTRIVGNVVLSTVTRLTSGYHHVFDSQCGYTAIHRRALEALDLHNVFPRYGYPNDLLSRLNVVGMRVIDVPVRPIYGEDWKSGIRLGNALHTLPRVLLRSWSHRLGARRRPSPS
jgi:glycosyltransferase involved in cell wall biosynthesis